MYSLYLRTSSVVVKLLLKLIALALIPIPGILMLLFTAGSFLLTIIAGICSIAASIIILSVLIMVYLSMPLSLILVALGSSALMMLISILVTVGQSAIQLLLVGAVAYLTTVLTASLKTQTMHTVQFHVVPDDCALPSGDEIYYNK